MDYNNYNHHYAQAQQTTHMLDTYYDNQAFSTIGVPCNPQPLTNRYVYVNQNFRKPSTVLINPNFRKTVHVNPNFKETVHINPNFLGQIHVNPRIVKVKDVHIEELKPEEVKCDIPVQCKPIISTRTKLVRKITVTKKIKDVSMKRLESRQSVHTKYKIIRLSGEQKLPVRNSKYKIDRTATERIIVKKHIRSIYRLPNTSSMSVLAKNKKRLININGVLYKKTPNVLRKADLPTKGIQTNSNKSKLLKIDGRVFKLNRNNRKLTLRRSLSNSASSKKLVNKSILKKKIMLSQIKDFKNKILSSKMRKSNVPCLMYRRYGRCPEKDNGRCIRIHNADQISLCTRFLQGACRNNNCLLSHKVSDEKVPTCKYFLEGLCSREDCPYLHVKINPKAEICKDFLEGFCKKAKQCDQRHQFLCPDFERNGSCPRKMCQYPHGNVVRNFRLRSKVAKTSARNLTKKSPETANNVKPETVDKNVRYYIDPSGDPPITLVDKVECDYEEIEVCDSPKRRKNVGDLPSFIPL